MSSFAALESYTYRCDGWSSTGYFDSVHIWLFEILIKQIKFAFTNGFKIMEIYEQYKLKSLGV